ncbi:TetR/AcrR family transcriptional regulator [Gordonia sp. VNK1]|jgi:AcrR family transcriptional regulator|uniref:TetR/AcrR family transcriptional regulator n=1 Tax=Gordonia oleivorans TaxID=3156618 RepID=UPI0032B37B66
MRSRGKIIEATLDLISTEGFAAASIAAVAAKAGVSRQTVYSIFGSREDMVSQAMGELAISAMREIHDRLEGITDFGDFLIEFIIAGRSMAIADPALSVLLNSQESHPFFDEGAMARTREVAAEILRPAVTDKPEYRPHFADIVDMTALLSVSLVAVDDGHRSDDELRAFLGRWLRPALDAMARPSDG